MMRNVPWYIESRMIEAVIFDMDGILINSEPMWRDAEIEVFKQVGLHLKESDCTETMGVPIREVVEYHFRKTPWKGPTTEEVTNQIIAAMVKEIRENGKIIPGAAKAIEFVKSKKVRIALASSSNYRLIETVLKTLGLENMFEIIHSAEEEPMGKPDPGVYLSTAKKLGVPASHCLAIEDSVNGVLAAKAAGMKCIAIPDKRIKEQEKYEAADLVLKDLTQIDTQGWDKLAK